MKTIAPLLFGGNHQDELRERTAASPHAWPVLLILLLALAPAGTGFGQMTLSSLTFGVMARAGASDPVVGEDRPPDRIVVWVTDTFGLLATNAVNQASAGSAGAQAGATNIAWAGPSALAATGSVNIAAFSTTNRYDEAWASARAWVDFRFTLPYTHAYRLESFLEGPPVVLFNYIALEPDVNPLVLRTLPTDTGAATNWGRLAPGLHQLVADFVVDVHVGNGVTATRAADYWLRLELTPIPTLAIRRSGPDVVLSWTTNAAGFELFHTTNVVSPNWQSTAWPTVIVGDEYTVTEPASEQQRFYRLVAWPR